jgi:hypothetical protein
MYKAAIDRQLLFKADHMHTFVEPVLALCLTESDVGRVMQQMHSVQVSSWHQHQQHCHACSCFPLFLSKDSKIPFVSLKRQQEQSSLLVLSLLVADFALWLMSSLQS